MVEEIVEQPMQKAIVEEAVVVRKEIPIDEYQRRVQDGTLR